MAKKRSGKLDEPKGESVAPSQAMTCGKRVLNIKEIDEVTTEQYLLAHPVVASGVDKRANRIINRSYDVIGPKQEMVDECSAILERSGGEILIKNWIKDAYAFGDGWVYLVYSADTEKPEVVKIRQKHPVFFGYYKETAKGSGFSGEDKYQIVFDENGKPKGFCEWVLKDGKRVPKGFVANSEENNVKIISPDKVGHLLFETWGDELEGTSVVQYAHLTIKYLLNIEEAGAEAMYRNGFVQKKFTTNLTSEKAIREFAKKVQNANDTDSIILARDTNVENLTPGSTDFVPFHEEFMKLLSVPIGIPRPLLTMDGTDTNKATLESIKDEMYEDAYADELVIKRTIDEQIFARICKLKWPEASEDDYPQFSFRKRPKTLAAELETQNRKADIYFKLAQASNHAFQMGLEDEAKTLMRKFIDEFDDLEKIEESYEPGIRAKFEDIQNDKGRIRGTVQRKESCGNSQVGKG